MVSTFTPNLLELVAQYIEFSRGVLAILLKLGGRLSILQLERLQRQLIGLNIGLSFNLVQL